jgi:hypothetical protein
MGSSWDVGDRSDLNIWGIESFTNGRIIALMQEYNVLLTCGASCRLLMSFYLSGDVEDFPNASVTISCMRRCMISS